MDNKKLIINFIIEYFFPEIGGLEKSTERLARQLVKSGHKVNIITKLSINGTFPHEVRNGVEIFRYNGDYLAAAQDLYDHADINCIFGVGHDIKEDVWDTVFNAHKKTFIKIGTSGDMLKFYEKCKAFAKFDAILCQNTELCNEVAKLGLPGVNAECIKNGLDIKEWDKQIISKKEARKTLGIPQCATVVCAVGRFVTRKNFPLIIEGCNRYVEKYNNNDFVLILHGGANGQHDSDEKTINLLIDKYAHNFRIITRSTLDAVPETLSAGDLFITMGTKEGAPNIIIEAMASALPIIASNISGHDVYVDQDNGKLIDFNKEDIADALNEVLSNPDLINHYARTSKERSYNFDISKTAETYLKVFYKYLM